MFNFNEYNNAEPLDLYLCRPNGKVICVLNGIQDESTSLTVNMNDQFELTFDYDKYVNVDGVDVKSNGYNKLSYGMNVAVPGIGLFKMEHPKCCFDGDKYYKSITTHSIDCELEDKYLVDYKVNTGEETSMEYLVTYEDGETESLLNEYTGIPYDFIMFDNTYPQELAKISGKYSDGIYTDSATINKIKQYCDLVPRLRSRVITTDESSSIEEYVIFQYDSSGENITKVELVNFNARVTKLIDFYTKYHDQLSLISLTLNMTGCDWTVGEIDTSLANKKFKFDVNTNVYSFFTQDAASAAECIFEFDLFHKKVNVRKIENIGKDSGVFLDKYNLLNTLDIDCEDNHLYTRYTVSGGNDMNIRDVNFGENVISDLTYQMKVRDDDGDLIYVTEELAQKYFKYVDDREIAREKYIELKRNYNQLVMEVDDITLRVPNDVCKTDWGTYSEEELEAADMSYTNLLNTLLTLYKEEYGTNGLNDDGSVKESVMQTTIYWNDYYSYKQALVQIKAAAEALANGSNYNKIKDGDDEELKKSITAYETQWDLYGTKELENKVKAYDNQMKCLVQKDLVVDENGVAVAWDDLTEDQQKEFSDPVSYEVIYNQYVEYYTERNECQAYLDTLLVEVAEKESQMEEYKKQYTEIVKLVTLQGYDRTALGKIVTLKNPTLGGSFTTDDIRTINLLYVDNTYSNENILTTSLDDVVTQIEVERELLADAKEKLSAAAQPQMTFSVDIDALLCMPEFKDYEFVPGNYVYVEYIDDYYAKLRLYSMKFNPRIPTEAPHVTFTNYVSSNAKRSDLSYILGQATGSGSGGGSSSGSGSGGTFGTSDDNDVTISNTMLAKMLNTELFGTRVTDVVLDNLKVNALNAKVATFGGLADGTTQVDGKCIRTSWIVDSKYNGDKTKGTITNTKGTIINLESGSFSFAGGKIKYDSSMDELTLGSDVTISWSQVTDANSQTTAITKNTITTSYVNALGITAKDVKADWVYAGQIKAGQIKTGTITSTDGTTTKINLDYGSFSFAGGKLKYDGSTLSLNGTIETNNGVIGGWTINSTGIYKITGTKGVYVMNGTNSNNDYLVVNELNSDGSWKSTPFYVRSTGKLYAADATIKGSITATSGKIGSFNINNSLYTNSNTLIYRGSDSNVYLGSDGIGFGNSYLSSGGGMALRSYDGTTAQLEGGSLYLFTNDGTDIPYLEAVAANTKANSGLHLYCPADFGSTLSISGAVTCKSNLTVNKSATFNSTIDCDSSITAYKRVYVEALGRKIGLAAQDGDKVGLYDYTNSRWLIYSDSDGGIPIRIPTKLSVGEYINPDYAISCSSFICDGWLRTKNNYGWYSEDYGGGIYMNDTGSVKVYNNKSFYCNNEIRAGLGGSGQFRAVAGNYGFFIRNDGANTYFMLTNSGDAYGTWNSLRPLTINDSTGEVTIGTNAIFDSGISFKDYSGHTRKPASSASPDGARVSYIASKQRTSDTKYYVTIQGQYGTKGSTYSEYNYLSTSSDVRLKENIKPTMIDALSTINQIKVRQFDWKHGTHQKIGFVADELETLDTGFTVGGGINEDGTMNIKSIDSFYLLGYVVKAIQELSKENDELKKEISYLKNSAA